MPGNGESRRSNEYNRRSILRSAGAAGASMTFAGIASTASATPSCGLPNQSDQDTEEDYQWRRSNSDYYIEENTNPLKRLTEIQSGLVLKDSAYVEEVGRWEHFFRSFGAGYTLQETYSKGEYEPTPSLSQQEVKITNKNQDMAALQVMYNRHEVGAAPSPGDGDDLDFGKAAWTAALGALSTTSTFAAVGIPAVQAFAALLDNGEPGYNGTVTYDWPYEMDNAPCESVHFVKYEFQSRPGKHDCNFNVKHKIWQYSGNWVMNEYDVYVDPVPYDPVPYQGVANADNRPKPGTSEYTRFLERTDVAKKVPYKEIEDPRIRELSDGGPIYRARNPSVSVTINSDGGESAENRHR